MVAPIADFVISLGSDGQILSQGTITDALAMSSKLRDEVKEEKAIEEKAAENFDVPAPYEEVPQNDSQKDGKLIVEEETAEGHVSWQSGLSIVFI